MAGLKQRVLHVLIAFDQLLHVLVTLGRGFPDETLSSAAYRAEKGGKVFGRIFRPVIDWLFLPLERDHCWRSYQAEQHRTQLPKELRG